MIGIRFAQKKSVTVGPTKQCTKSLSIIGFRRKFRKSDTFPPSKSARSHLNILNFRSVFNVQFDRLLYSNAHFMYLTMKKKEEKSTRSRSLQIRSNKNFPTRLESNSFRGGMSYVPLGHARIHFYTNAK